MRILANFLKPLALVSSVSLVITFLLYREGYFDDHPLKRQPGLSSSPNSGTVGVNNTATSVPRPKDSNRVIRLSSSKSMVVTDELNLHPGEQVDTQVSRRKSEFLSSSKSGIVLNEQQVKALDSLFKRRDSVRSKKGSK